jgi:LEA14-like dessication related protein
VKKLLPYGILAVAGYFAWRYFRKGIAGRLLNVKVRKLNLFPLKSANLEIDVINPTNSSINFDSITLDLSVNGYPISTLNYQKNTTISANGVTTIKLPIVINPLESGQFVFNLLTTKGKIKTIQVKGTINGEGIVIPVDVTNQLSA